MNKKKLNRLLEKRAALDVQINAEKALCQHPNLSGKYGADTGNYCRSDDEYWVDMKCPGCGEWWRVYSNDPMYREYGLMGICS